MEAGHEKGKEQLRQTNRKTMKAGHEKGSWFTGKPKETTFPRNETRQSPVLVRR